MYQSVSRIGQTNLVDKQVCLNTQQTKPSEQDIKNALVSGKKRGKRLRKIKKLSEAAPEKKEKVDILVDDNLDDSSNESSDDESDESDKGEDNLDEEESKSTQNELEKAQKSTNMPEESKGLNKVPGKCLNLTKEQLPNYLKRESMSSNNPVLCTKG